jgi:hypothetical protein
VAPGHLGEDDLPVAIAGAVPYQPGVECDMSISGTILTGTPRQQRASASDAKLYVAASAT